MGDDIVDRLRWWVARRGWQQSSVQEAADEIERLRAENADLRKTIDALSTANHWQWSPPLSEADDG